MGNQLTIGSNNLSTIFSGVIQTPPIPRGAEFVSSLVKIGNGTLILSGANTYAGPTIVESGKLIVNGSIISAVTVNGGALGGSGLISRSPDKQSAASLLPAIVPAFCMFKAIFRSR